MQLVPVDRARIIPVKVAVDILPVLDVLPKARELAEADRSAPVSVLCPCNQSTRPARDI